jgi:hypothetical protein
MRRQASHAVIALAGAFVFLVAAVAAQSPSGVARLNGVWVLNRQQSSSFGGGGGAAPEGGGRRHGGFSGGVGRPGGGMGPGAGGGSEEREAMERQRALMRELLEPLPRVTVTSDTESVTFTASDGRVRKYRIDGRKEKHQFDNGTVETKSKFEKDQLIIETSPGSGMKLVETYSINDQHQLVVEAKFEGGSRGDRAPIVHVYDDASTQLQ